ncbi:hypothetical protein C0J52_03778 [Blattella germanica]|nr:hypothetical protein C0J52_03778 [Blattella germanica]
MFTKLKNKIAEEVKQSPLKLSASVQQLAQAVVSPSSSSIVEPASNDHFSIGEDSEETPQNSPSKSGGFQSVELHGDVPVSPPVQAGGRSRRSSTCSTVLVESQDKALRRIAELKEQSLLERKAKAHLEDVLRNDLEEKDHLINTLYTKLELLKSNGGKETDDSLSQKENSSENLLIDLSGEANATAQPNSTQNESLSTEAAEAYEEKLKKLNALLSKCKESIKRNKDRISQLSSENQQLQQELEETKTSSSSQLSTLTEDLTVAPTALQNEVTELKSAASNSLPTEDVIATEEDRKNLIQELSRGKAEAVRLLQQEMQKKLIDLELKMTDKLQESETKNLQLNTEIETLKLQIEEKEKAYKTLEQEQLAVRKETMQLETQKNRSDENVRWEKTVKDLEMQLDVTQSRLSEKENAIADIETNYKRTVEEYVEKISALEAKVGAEIADRQLIEGKLSEKDNEISELNNKHDEQLKNLSEIKSVLDSELLKHNETEKMYKELLNQMGNLEISITNKDSEIESWKERVQTLESKLKESEDGYGKMRKEKENLSLILVSSMKSITQLKNSLKILRSDVSSALHNVGDDVATMKTQFIKVFEKTLNEFTNVKQELESKIKEEDNLKKTVLTLEKELNEQKESIKFAGDLEGLLEELRASKRHLESELSENSALVKKLQNELENTTKTLEAKDEELSKLHNCANGLQQELTQTSQKMNNDLMNLKNEYTAKLEAKVTECADMQNKLRDSENSINSLQNYIKQAESRLEESNKHFEITKLENEKLNNRVKDLETASEALKAETTNEKEGLIGNVEELSSSLEKYKEENDKLTKKLEECAESSDKTKELQLKVEKISKELLNCNEEKEVLSRQVEEISEKASVLSKDIQLQEEAWKKEKKADKGKMKKLEHAISSLEAQLQKEKAKYETEISNLSSQLEQSLQKEKELCSSSETLKETLKNKNEGSQKSISNLKKQLDKSHEMAEELSARVETITKENVSHLELLEKRKLEIQNLEAEKDNISSKFDSQKNVIQELESKIHKLTEEMEKLSTEKTMLENNEREVSQSKAELEGKLNLEAETRSLMEEEYQSLNKSADELRYQVEQLTSQLANLQETNETRVSEIEVLHSERKAMQQFLNNAAINENQYRARIEAIEEITTNLKAENNDLNLAVTAKSQQLADLKKELEMLLSERNALQELQQNFEELSMENSSLSQQLQRILKENKSLEQQLKSEVDYQEQGRTALEKIHIENEELKKQAESVSEKNSELESRLMKMNELLEVAESKLKTEQENNVTEDLKTQLEETLKEKENIEDKLKAEIESSKELEETTSLELERLQAEKEQLEQQLDNTLMDLQAKEKQVADLEDIHAQKIKQFEQEDNIQMKEYREQVRELQEAAELQAEAYQQLYLQHEDCKQAAHQKELSKADERWRKCLEQQLTEAEAKHKQELTELSKEWHWERKNHVLNTEEPVAKELESTSQLAVAAVESGTGSIELLHRQLVAQTNELKETKRKHRLEVAELQRLLSLRRPSKSGDRGLGKPTLEDACTELEYLRNILYEYMMGKEPVVLARVIAAVVNWVNWESYDSCALWLAFYRTTSHGQLLRLSLVGVQPVLWCFRLTTGCGSKKGVSEHL